MKNINVPLKMNCYIILSTYSEVQSFYQITVDCFCFAVDDSVLYAVYNSRHGSVKRRV